jgi:hypothetical protein
MLARPGNSAEQAVLQGKRERMESLTCQAPGGGWVSLGQHAQLPW